MISKLLKKNVASLLSIALIGGALPIGLGRYSLKNNAIVADAASTVTVAEGAVFRIGDLLDFGTDVYYWGGYSDYKKMKTKGINEVTDANYTVEEGKTDYSCSVTVGYNIFKLSPIYADTHDSFPDYWTYEGAWGYIVNGTGTYEDPYWFQALKFDPQKVANAVTVSEGAVFQIDDLIVFDADKYCYVGINGWVQDKISGIKQVFSAEYNITDYEFYDYEACVTVGDRYLIRDIAFSPFYADTEGYFTDNWTSADAWGYIVMGTGTYTDPYYLCALKNAPEKNTSYLTKSEYKQTADKNGKHYIRYVFVKNKSELEGKSKAVFSVSLGGTKRTFETSKYYTGMTSNGTYYKAISNNEVLFVVTITGVSAANEKNLICDLKLV